MSCNRGVVDGWVLGVEKVTKEKNDQVCEENGVRV